MNLLFALLWASTFLERSGLFVFAQQVSSSGSFGDGAPCATLVQTVGQYGYAWASAGIACLRSIPFHSDDALTFLDFFNQTILQLQSTTAYLKNPPPSYQQPAVDLHAQLAALRTAASNGTYSNQYDFERDFRLFIQSAHDGHLNMGTPALSLVSFTAPLHPVALSVDGLQVPDIYTHEDMIQWTSSMVNGWTPSAWAFVNGEKVVDFFKAYGSANAFGYVDPDSEFNNVMLNPVGLIPGAIPSIWAGSPLYLDDWLNVTFANGSETRLPFKAVVPGVTADTPLELFATGQGIYDKFIKQQGPGVGGVPAAAANPSATATAFFPSITLSNGKGNGNSQVAGGVVEERGGAGAAVTAVAGEATLARRAVPSPTVGVSNGGGGSSSNQLRWSVAAFPPPDIWQTHLGGPGRDGGAGNAGGLPGSGAYGTGYFITLPPSGNSKSEKLAVFSLPSFAMMGTDASGFANFTRDFIRTAKQRGATKVLFDVSSNGGGITLLPYEMMRQFFPASYPYIGGRMRYNPAMDALGDELTAQYLSNNKESNHSLSDKISSLPWISPSHINEQTGKLFGSWAEMAKPYSANGDQFMQTEVQDLSNPAADIAATGMGFVVTGPGNAADQPWAVEDLAILTDGQCGSTCTIFMELFKHQMNVKTIAVGGLPTQGPMQMSGSVRGCAVMEAPALKSVVDALQTFPVLPGRADAAKKVSSLLNVNDTGIALSSGSFNIWDNVRPNETLPQHFAYQAADCRIFYTGATYNNMTNLWSHAAAAAFSNSSLCVDGSTGQPSAVRPYFTDTCGPAGRAKDCKQDDAKWGTADHSTFVNPLNQGVITNATQFSQQQGGDGGNNNNNNNNNSGAGAGAGAGAGGKKDDAKGSSAPSGSSSVSRGTLALLGICCFSALALVI